MTRYRLFLLVFGLLCNVSFAENTQPLKYTMVNTTQVNLLFDLNVPVIDIRRKDEWRDTGIIPGSTLLTMFSKSGEVKPRFEKTFPLLVKPDDQVVLVSDVGVDSKVAAELLSEQLGYSKIYVLEGGMAAWLYADLDVVDP